MKDFKKLKVWQKSHGLTLDIYRVTARFPKEEVYGLTSQMRRSAASISANIAEGCGRYGDVELARFLHIAIGSASEIEYHLLLSHDLKFVATSDYEKISNEVVEVKRMLTSFIQKLRADR